MDETVETIPRNDRIVVRIGLNGHVVRIGLKGNNGDEECMGRHGLGKRNNEGQAVVDFAKRRELAITNTYFVKKPAHIVTYSSGGRSLQVDYILVRRQRIKDVVDTKVIADERVAKQHRISGQCDNHLDKVEESTKTSEENKMVEAKRLESQQ